MNRNSTVTFNDARSSNPPTFLDAQRGSNGWIGQSDFPFHAQPHRGSNTSNTDIAAEHSRYSNINKANQFAQLKTFPKVMSWSIGNMGSSNNSGGETQSAITENS